MPRSKLNKKPKPSYTLDDIRHAVEDIKALRLSQRAASAKYGIPKTLLQERVSGKVSLNVIGAGRPPALSEKVEKEIEECIIGRAKFGYPCDRFELCNLIGDYVKINNLKTPFKNNVPGEDWYLGFMKRHPKLSLKKPEHLQKLRKDATKPTIVYDFYDKLSVLCKEKVLEGPEKASFLFNADESGFNSDPSRVRGIGEKGKTLSRVSGGSGRESTTVLACISADGKTLPPLIVFKGAAVQARWTSETAFPGTVYAASANGWMEEPQFYNWFCSAFIPHVLKVRTEKNMPDQAALLLFDGHSSHVSLRISGEAIKNNISLLRLPSHLTDKLQPLDKCVFGPLKTSWDIQLVEYGKANMGRTCGRLSKEKFVELLSNVWRKSMSAANIVSGFEATGVYPVNSERFRKSDFNPIDLEEYEKNEAAEQVQHNCDFDIVEIQQPSCSNSLVPTPKATFSPSSSHSATQLSPSSNLGSLESSRASTPKSVMDIFADRLTQACSSWQTPTTGQRKVIPRLKTSRYGEVLTTEAVMQRLRDAELKKAEKARDAELKKAEKARDAELKKAEKASRKSAPRGKKSSTSGKKTRLMRASPSQVTLNQSSSEDDSPAEMVYLDHSSSDVDLVHISVPEVEYEHPSMENVTAGRYILVEIIGGKRNSVHYKYVCCIQSVDDEEEEEEITVVSMKHINDSVTEFILSEKDVFQISYLQVKAVLPEPTLTERDRKIVYVFPGSVDVFEKN